MIPLKKAFNAFRRRRIPSDDPILSEDFARAITRTLAHYYERVGCRDVIVGAYSFHGAAQEDELRRLGWVETSPGVFNKWQGGEP